MESCKAKREIFKSEYPAKTVFFLKVLAFFTLFRLFSHVKWALKVVGPKDLGLVASYSHFGNELHCIFAIKSIFENFGNFDWFYLGFHWADFA